MASPAAARWTAAATRIVTGSSPGSSISVSVPKASKASPPPTPYPNSPSSSDISIDASTAASTTSSTTLADPGDSVLFFSGTRGGTKTGSPGESIWVIVSSVSSGKAPDSKSAAPSAADSASLVRS